MISHALEVLEADDQGTDDTSGEDASISSINIDGTTLTSRPSIYSEHLLRRRGDIRVLRLNDAFRTQSPLHGKLRVVNLDSNPKFEALSYTWGPPYKDQVLTNGCIHINGQPKAIKGNLNHALRRLRFRPRPLDFWIDALCINQDDPSERTAQVAIMADIYSSATRALVWLGEDSHDRDGKYVLGFHRAKRFLQRTHLFSHLRRESSDLTWPFAARYYFQRRWIVQELCFSRETIVMCGQYSVPTWEALVDCLNTNDVWQLQDLLRFIGTLRKEQEFRRIEGYEVSQSVTRILNPLTTLCTFRQAECRDPKDRLAALTSLWPNFSFRCNYSLSLEEVYFEFGKAILTSYPGQFMWENDLLYVAAYQAQLRGRDLPRLDLPSWLPDWRVAVPPPPNITRETRFYPDPRADVLEDGRLNITLHYYGQVISRLYRGIPNKCLVTPNDQLKKAMPPGSHDRTELQYLNPSLKAGDVLCEAGPMSDCHHETWMASECSFALQLRPTQGQTEVYHVVGVCPLFIFFDNPAYDENFRNQNVAPIRVIIR